MNKQDNQFAKYKNKERLMLLNRAGDGDDNYLLTIKKFDSLVGYIDIHVYAEVLDVLLITEISKKRICLTSTEDFRTNKIRIFSILHNEILIQETYISINDIAQYLQNKKYSIQETIKILNHLKRTDNYKLN